jgi:hypothetical protein
MPGPYNRRAMSALPPDKSAAVDRLRRELESVRGLRGAARAEAAVARDRAALRAWQAARFARTYADLLAAPRYTAAASFFLSDLYGPTDPAARDEAVARSLPTMVRLLPAAALDTIAGAVELDALSERLDLAMVRTFRRRQPEGELAISEASYAEAYRAAAERSERERQIGLVNRIGIALDRLARTPWLAGALAMMEAPARAAGVAALHDFLVRGFRAFRQMRGAAEFLATVEARERRINERLYAGDPQPFAAA